MVIIAACSSSAHQLLDLLSEQVCSLRSACLLPCQVLSQRYEAE